MLIASACSLAAKSPEVNWQPYSEWEISGLRHSFSAISRVSRQNSVSRLFESFQLKMVLEARVPGIYTTPKAASTH